MVYQDNSSLQNPKLGSRVGPKTYDKIRLKKKKKHSGKKNTKLVHIYVNLVYNLLIV